MPFCKRKCDCILCDSKCEPVISKKIRQHYERYGKADESDSSGGEEIPSTVKRRSEPSIASCTDTDDEPDVNVEHLSDDDDNDHHINIDDDRELLTASDSCVDSERSDDLEFNDFSDVNSDELDSNLPISEECWEFSYNPDIYNQCPAVQFMHASKNLSLLQFLARNFDLFTRHPSMSKAAFGEILNVQKSLLCSSRDYDILPSSFESALNIVKPYLIQKKVFHACINDCVLFRGSLSDLRICPICTHPRYHDHNAARPVPWKRFIYLPIGPRLARIYGEESLAKIVQAHSGNTPFMQNDQLNDIHQSPAWKSLYSRDGYFNGDKSGLAFALEVDGVNPYHNIGISYSMTPIMLTLLNLPRHIRNAFGNIMLVGIIPGNRETKSEASNMNSYISVLVDELLSISGRKVTDAYSNAPVEVKIKLLLYVLDYPGLSKLFSQLGSGSIFGCHWCWIRGVYCKHLQKVIYLNNRSFLEPSNAIRNDIEHFKEKVEDLSDKPPCRTDSAEILYRQAYENASTKTLAKEIASATGSKGNYPLALLPGHNRIHDTLPDAMHTIKDVIQNILYYITGRKVNADKILSCEKTYGRFSSSENSSTGNYNESDDISGQSRLHTNRVPFMLTQKELNAANERGKNIRTPLGFGLKPGSFMTHLGTLKSHDYKQLASQGVLKYCLKGTLGLKQRTTLFILLDCFQQICSECHTQHELDHLEIKVNEALALFERDFPLHLQNITTHLIHHIVPGLRRFGPVYGTWMYVFECFNSWICKRALNMRYPEATAIQTFILYDWCQFMINSGKIIPEYQNAHDDIENECECEGYCKKSNITLNLHEINELKREYQRNGIRISADSFETCCQKSYRHSVRNSKTHRMVHYTSSSKEHASAKTVSSVICFENDKGDARNQISLGTFLYFGKIHHFILHNDDKITSHFARVGWYEMPSFDNETGLWYVNYPNVKNYTYCCVESLSPPLVTAIETIDTHDTSNSSSGKIMWICNSMKQLYRG